MADTRVRGDAQEIAQVDSSAFGGTWSVSDTVTVTMNQKDVTYTVPSGGTAIDDILAGLLVLLAAETEPEFAEVQWSIDISTDTLKGTAKTAGNPVTWSITETSATGTVTDPPTAVTANDGSSNLSADNMSTGSVSMSIGDDIVFENIATDILDTLDQFSSDQLGDVRIKANFTGRIGRPLKHTGGYYEYRTRELTIDCDNLIVGEGSGNGSKRLLINNGSTQVAVTVYKTNTSEDPGLHAMRWRGTHASNTFTIYGGSVDVAPELGHLATIATLTAAGGTIRLSNGTTVTTINAYGGSIVHAEPANNPTTLTIHGQSQVTIDGGKTWATINLRDGRLKVRGSGTTITQLNGGDGGILDLSEATGTVTVTNMNTPCRFRVIDPHGVLSMTNPADGVGAKLQDIQIETAAGAKWKVTY